MSTVYSISMGRQSLGDDLFSIHKVKVKPHDTVVKRHVFLCWRQAKLALRLPFDTQRFRFSIGRSPFPRFKLIEIVCRSGVVPNQFILWGGIGGQGLHTSARAWFRHRFEDELGGEFYYLVDNIKLMGERIRS